MVRLREKCGIMWTNNLRQKWHTPSHATNATEGARHTEQSPMCRNLSSISPYLDSGYSLLLGVSE